ncbi:trimeric LpxA-like protein [Lipomyces japonicus]|uniref:trimeric LpxA-like protein n=1 Tax=Lipomyces japonicus TaxID=56871 RepID=UPI0034CE878D
MSRVKRGDFIETDSGNRISRKAVISGSQHILLGGKSTILHGCEIRGDILANTTGTINIGRYALFEQDVVVRPPSRASTTTAATTETHYPVKIGSYVRVGAGTVVEAAAIGSYVHIGSNCRIGRFAIIKDCVLVLDNAIIPDATVVPPLSVVAGNPAVVVRELPESAADVFERRARQTHAVMDLATGEALDAVFDDRDDVSFDL